MSGYQDWCLDGWRTHLPGVTDVPDCVARLGGESLPARVAVTVDGDPVTHAELDEASGRSRRGWPGGCARGTGCCSRPQAELPRNQLGKIVRGALG